MRPSLLLLLLLLSLCSSPLLSSAEYNDTQQEQSELCPAGVYFDQDQEEGQKKACQFRRSELGLCSGLSDPSFGYADGKPCILIKMNRVPHPLLITPLKSN